MLHPTLRFSREELAQLCQRYHIRELCIFGSATRNDFKPESDVDLLIEHEAGYKLDWNTYWDMHFALEELLGRPVDLVEGRASLQNPYRRSSILRSLERL